MGGIGSVADASWELLIENDDGWGPSRHSVWILTLARNSQKQLVNSNTSSAEMEYLLAWDDVDMFGLVGANNHCRVGSTLLRMVGPASGPGFRFVGCVSQTDLHSTQTIISNGN